MASQETWNKLARNLGYKDEAAMLRHLHGAKGMPPSKIAIMCGCGYHTVINRLKRYGIKLRPLSELRSYRRSLSAVGDALLFEGSAIETAEAFSVHRSTVHRERQRRLAASPRPAASITPGSITSIASDTNAA